MLTRLFYRYPFKYSGSVILLIFGLVLAGTIFAVNYALGVSEAKKDEIERISNRLNDRQGTLEAFLRFDDDVNIGRMMANASLDGYITAAFLIDAEGNIVAATQKRWIGEPAAEFLNSEEIEIIDSVRESLHYVVTNSFEGDLFYGVSPVQMGSGPDGLRTGGIGVYFEKYDFDGIRQHIIATERFGALIAMLILLAGIFTMSIVLYLGYVKRIDRIISSVRKFSEGDVHVRAALEGHDEIAMLSATFDVMVEKITDYQVQLQKYVDTVDRNIITSSADLEGNIIYASEAFCKTSGYAREELMGKPHSILRHRDMPEELYRELWETITRGDTWRGEIKNLAKTGSEYWVDAVISPNFDNEGKIVSYTAVRQDITDKKRIEEMSVTDGLTGLYNRRYFNRKIKEELSRIMRDGRCFVLVIMDVDNFKKYNDNYGHQMGDEVLMAIGKLFTQTIKRAGDIAFRIGGEEFALIYAVDQGDNAFVVVENVRKELEALNIPHALNDGYGHVTASFGMRVVDFKKEKNVETDTLYRQADEALYAAKEGGRNQVVRFDIGGMG